MLPATYVGTGIVSPAANPDLQTAAYNSLRGTIHTALQDTGVFNTGDDPSGALNLTLAAQIDDYALAYAQAIASMTASVVYAGGGGAPTPAPVLSFGSVV
jgi:hypothetical protein